MARKNFEELIQDIDFPQYVINKGYQLNKRKSTNTHKVFGRGERGNDDEIIITRHRNPPHNYVYKSISNPEGDKGNIVNFVIRRLSNYVNTGAGTKQDYRRVNELLHEYLNIPIEDREMPVKALRKELEISVKKEPFNYHLYGAKPLEDTSYLESRGIDKDTIESPLFKGRIVEAKPVYWDEKKDQWFQDTNYHTCFPMSSISNEIIGIQVHRKTDKRFGKNSDRETGFWSSNILPSTNTIAIAEEAIDALSHSIMHNAKQNIAYAATFGTPSLHHPNAFHKLLIDHGISNLCLINDNDKAGHEFNLRYLLHFFSSDHNIRLADMDKQKVVLEIDPATINEENRMRLLMSLKSYNTSKSKDISNFCDSLELKNSLLESETFKYIKVIEQRDRFIIPRNEDALSLFNHQLLKAFDGKVQGLSISIHHSVTKDFNDDLKIVKKIENINNLEPGVGLSKGKKI